MEYYSAIKRTKFCYLQQATWMKLEGIMLNEMSEKDKYTVYQLYVKSKKNTSTSEYNKKEGDSQI